MSAIFMAHGTVHMGIVRQHKNGATETVPPKFEEDDKGGCIIIGKAKFEDQGDSFKMVQDGPADVFGDYEAWEYFHRVVELLRPVRTINMPDFEDLVKHQAKHGGDICGGCKDSLLCENCIVHRWLEEAEEEDGEG